MEKQQLIEKVKAYCHLVHTQSPEEFDALWSKKQENVLISGGNCFVGSEAILNDFLLGAIRNAFSRIELISKTIDVRLLDDDHAIIVFSYETDCDNRKDGSWFGIEGLETQVYVKEAGDWRLTHVQYSGKAIERKAD